MWENTGTSAVAQAGPSPEGCGESVVTGTQHERERAVSSEGHFRRSDRGD